MAVAGTKRPPYLLRQGGQRLSRGYDMNTTKLHEPIDIMDVEVRARQLRAETLAHGLGVMRRWVAAPFHRRTAIKV